MCVISLVAVSLCVKYMNACTYDIPNVPGVDHSMQIIFLWSNCSLQNHYIVEGFGKRTYCTAYIIYIQHT